MTDENKKTPEQNSKSPTQNLVDKKIFLLVSESAEKIKKFQEIIERRVSTPTIYTATDGATALSKVINAPPHVLITELHLQKLSGLNLIDKILESHNSANTAIIIDGEPPKEEKHLDELVTNKIQYLANSNDELEFNTRLVRALNFSARSKKADFYVRFLAKDELLLKEGDKADCVYLVKKGQLKAFKGEANPNTPPLGFIQSGEFVGEMAYINGEPRTANVSAVTDCELIEVPLGTFDKVLFKRPLWAKALMLTLSKRLKAANVVKTPT